MWLVFFEEPVHWCCWCKRLSLFAPILIVQRGRVVQDFLGLAAVPLRSACTRDYADWLVSELSDLGFSTNSADVDGVVVWSWSDVILGNVEWPGVILRDKRNSSQRSNFWSLLFFQTNFLISCECRLVPFPSVWIKCCSINCVVLRWVKFAVKCFWIGCSGSSSSWPFMVNYFGRWNRRLNSSVFTLISLQLLPDVVYATVPRWSDSCLLYIISCRRVC